VKVKFVPLSFVKACGGGGISPLILNVRVDENDWSVSFVSGPLPVLIGGPGVGVLSVGLVASEKINISCPSQESNIIQGVSKRALQL
jgi:hypothetical protein